MWIAPGDKRFRYYTLAIMLIISLFQIWASGDCKAGAIRLFPPPDNNIHEATMKVVTTTTSTAIVDQKMNNSKLQDQQRQQEEDEDLFHKYFNGSQLQNITSTSTNEGMEDSKRRVPSCPDPLHNK